MVFFWQRRARGVDFDLGFDGIGRTLGVTAGRGRVMVGKGSRSPREVAVMCGNPFCAAHCWRTTTRQWCGASLPE